MDTNPLTNPNQTTPNLDPRNTFLANPKVTRVNDIKERILREPWSNLKLDKHLIEEAFADDAGINAADMIMAERAIMLGDIFSNSEIIPRTAATEMVKLLANFDANQGRESFKALANQIAPGVLVRENVDIFQYRNYAQILSNGLDNVHMMAICQMAEQIMPDINIAKRYDAKQAETLFLEISRINNGLRTKLDREQPLGQEEINKAADFLSKIGRSKFEIEMLKTRGDSFELASLLGKAYQSLGIVSLAYKENLVSRLNEIEIVASLLEKIQLNK